MVFKNWRSRQRKQGQEADLSGYKVCTTMKNSFFLALFDLLSHNHRGCRAIILKVVCGSWKLALNPRTCRHLYSLVALQNRLENLSHVCRDCSLFSRLRVTPLVAEVSCTGHGLMIRHDGGTSYRTCLVLLRCI